MFLVEQMRELNNAQDMVIVIRRLGEEKRL